MGNSQRDDALDGWQDVLAESKGMEVVLAFSNDFEDWSKRFKQNPKGKEQIFSLLPKLQISVNWLWIGLTAVIWLFMHLTLTSL